VLANIDRFIRTYWLPAGFLLFLSAFFFAPSQHNYKILIVDLLLLPALLTAFSRSAWSRALSCSPVLGLVIIYLAYMALNALALQTKDAAEFTQWGLYIALFLFAVGTRMQISDRQLINLLIMGALVAAGAAIFAIVHDVRNGLFQQPDYRLIGFGTLYNPLRSGNLFGAFTLIAAWGALTIEQRFLRPLAYCATLACFIATLLTGSRSPLVALLVTALCACTMESNRTRRLSWIIFILAISATVVTLYWSELSVRGTSLRPEIWRQVWQLCLTHIWFGVGLDTPLYIPTSNGIPALDTHNVFLAALFYGGIIGLILFCAPFFTNIFLGWRRRRSSTLAALAALLQLYGLIALQFDGGCLISRPNDFWVLYWLPVALYLRVAVGTASDKDRRA
jgi:O-antigen ligase